MGKKTNGMCEKIKDLKLKVAESEERLKNIRLAQEKTKLDLTDVQGKLIEAKKNIETGIFNVAATLGSIEDVKIARANERTLQAEAEDIQEIMTAHSKVEVGMKEATNALRTQLTTETKNFWAMVASELQEKMVKDSSSLLRETLAAKELAGWVGHDLGDILVQVFFQGGTPQLHEEKQLLVGKYF